MVGTLEEPAAIDCLSDDHKDWIKEGNRPKAEVASSQKKTFNEAVNEPTEVLLLAPLKSAELPYSKVSKDTALDDALFTCFDSDDEKGNSLPDTSSFFPDVLVVIDNVREFNYHPNS